MFERLFSLDRRRRRLLKRAAPGPLREYLEVPFADRGRRCDEVEYVAVDLETGGLDPRKDDIVSAGWVGLRGPCIDLSTARHRVVRQARAIPAASATIHHITDDRAAAGEPLETVVAELLAALAGRVLIAHHARVELGFLGAACERLWGAPLLVPTVDTQWLARRGRGTAAGDSARAAPRPSCSSPRWRSGERTPPCRSSAFC